MSSAPISHQLSLRRGEQSNRLSTVVKLAATAGPHDPCSGDCYSGGVWDAK
jgi:hypothetical protein